MFLTSDFDFNLPQNLIAQEPFFPKEKTKMLTFKDNQILDSQLLHLTDFLQAGDLLIFNDAKVVKAKLSARISRNSAILEFNLDQQNQGSEVGTWQALCRPAKKVKITDILIIAPDFSAEVLDKNDEGFIKIKFDCDGDILMQKLDKYGSIPIPPYIKRAEKNDDDTKNYQTIYAKNGVAAAAPTAGLHFNEHIFSLLRAKNINHDFITLNVGAGTFLPVRCDNIKNHKMHREFFSISDQTADKINQTKSAGGNIIAVGTTSLRALESATINGKVQPGSYNTNIFIYPSYQFKIVDVLMTNFHLPKSTLFMLVCAFVGKENAFKIYQHAMKNHYRFYSYGDSSILFRGDNS